MRDDPIDWSLVGEWMARHDLAGAEIEEVAPIGGGTQNLMYAFRAGDRSYVLRRGPRHLRPHTNDALRREARVLTALAGTDVPAPRLVAAEPDESVLGSVFYLMDPVDGFNASVALPQPHASDERLRHRMGLQAIDALARLGAVDHDAVGLADLGRPDGFLERQVPQWLDTLAAYRELPGYAGDDLPNVAAVSSWLPSNLPATFRPGILHGDFHLANLMYRNDGPEVAAVVDWEMCTIGDPLLDLGWLLATWPEPGTPSVQHTAIGRAGGLPRRQEILAHYGEVADRDLTHARWYAVMASFKLAIVLEGTHARACAGRAPRATGDLLHAMAVGLLDQARVFIDEGLEER